MTDRDVNPPASCTSSSLLARVKAQDQAAWQRLVDLYLPLIYRWCRQLGLQQADAADVGQDVLATVARKIVDFHRDQPGDTFRGWLRIITRNKVRDFFRKRHREAAGQGGSDAHQRLMAVAEPEPETQSAEAAGEEESQLYRQALELLKSEFEENTWRAFWRVAIE